MPPAKTGAFEPDVVIVGSGAGGGMAAYVLTRAGIKTLVLEAGRDYDPVTESAMFKWNHEAPLRASSTPDKHFGYYDATANGGWEVPGEPYTNAPGSTFRWWRSRMLGGRTNHWGRHVPRFGPYDFKPKTRDGLGWDWPLSYDDLAPYYDRTEKLIGVSGANSGLENHPDSSPGVLQPPSKPRVAELMMQSAAADLGIPCVPSRYAVLTRPIDHPDAPRQACFNATSCGRGCSIGAAFQTTTSLLPIAMGTGRLRIVTNAMVSRVLTDARGRARGVEYIGKDGAAHFVKARAVVLAASACESARILLNSHTAQLPHGLANSSGLVGRYLMDTTGTNVSGHIPALENRPRYNEDGKDVAHLYIPFWLYKEQAAGKLDFPRAYHYEIGGRFGMPGAGVAMADTMDGYGASLKEDARRYYGAQISLTVRGEMIPNANSYCELDPDVKDKHGLPVLRFHWKWSDHEHRQVAHGIKTARSIIERLGGKVLTPEVPPEQAIAVGGWIIHEVGTTRMGADPKDSVTDGFGRTWDIDNLVIADGSVFTSNAHKNPTLTIMALAWRSMDRSGGPDAEEGGMTMEISRRVTLGWVAMASATALAGCESVEAARQVAPPPVPPPPVDLWKDAALPPVSGPGYGQDPNLTAPSVPWSLTLNPHQRETLRIAADLMLPADARSPAGGSLHLDAFIDEWISAPYPVQQQDRLLIVSGLGWLDAETAHRFGADFAHATDGQRRAVFDTIAFRKNQQPGFEQPARFFARLRGLMLAGFYSRPEGIADIGYMGNTPVEGDYPGPTAEAMTHLNASLVKLGLKPVTPG